MSDEPPPPLRLKPRTPPPAHPIGAPAEGDPPASVEPAARPARPALRLVERPAEDVPVGPPPVGVAEESPAPPSSATAREPPGTEPPVADAPVPPDSATEDTGRMTLSTTGDPAVGGPPPLHIGLKGDAEPELPVALPTPRLPVSESPPTPATVSGFAGAAPSASSASRGVTVPSAGTPGAKPERRRAFRIGVYAAALLLLGLVGLGAGAFFRAVKRATEEKRGQVRATAAPAPTPTPPPAPSAVRGALAGAIAKAAVEVKKAEERKAAVEEIAAPPPRPTPEPDLSRFPPPSGRAAVAEAGASRAFVAFVESVRISGVFEGAPARALINGRTVRAGGVVDAPLGVVFVGVDVGARQVVFRDATGAFVRKPY
jgi:hypothetical protein